MLIETMRFQLKAFLIGRMDWNVLKDKSAQLLIVKQYKCLYPKQEMLCDSYALEKVENRKKLSVIIGTIRFLGRQGLALRGHQKTCTSNPTESGELDSNFVQLLRLRAEDNEGLHKFLNKKQDCFTSPDIQNEI